MKSENLIKEAVGKGWLTNDEQDHLNKLRKLRNPIVHFRDHVDETRPEKRSISESKTTTQIFKSDAEKILAAVINILNKTAL